MNLPGHNPEPSRREGVFVKTEWITIRPSPDAKGEELDRAREDLCRKYWQPIYLILCKRGYPSEQAKDLTQGFFLHLLKNNAAAAADPGKGLFRHFLLGALNHYLADLHDRERTQRRGGGAVHVSLDDPSALEPVALASENSSTQFEIVSDREWALEMTLRALLRLEKEYGESGRGELFRQLNSCLMPEGDSPTRYATIAGRLGRSEATVRSDARRMRNQFRALLRDEMCRCVGPARLDEEWENMRQTLRAK